MTTISSTVFSDVEGANAGLVNRVTDLINSSSIQGIDSFRDALRSGTITIRTGAPGEVQQGVGGIFKDPEAGAPGQVVINPDTVDRNSDTAVLRFFDTLIHEGMGHGISISQRAQIDRDLQSDRSIGGGQDFVRAFLDEESGARFTAYGALKEIVALSNGFSGQARALIQSDGMFSAFETYSKVADDFGMSGQSRTDFIIRSSRDEMAAYDKNFYLNEATNRAAQFQNQGQESDFTDAIDDEFDDVGYESGELEELPDGSFSSITEFEDGRSDNLYYYSNGQFNKDTLLVTNEFGFLDWEVTTFSDGSKNWTDYDQNNERPDFLFNRQNDAFGREDWAVTYYDDGSVGFTDYDLENQFGFSKWSNFVDSFGREDWQLSISDNGSTNWTDFDQANNRSDSVWQNSVDIFGRQDWILVTGDDGRIDWTDFDQDNSRGDQVWQNSVDPFGREDWVLVTEDNGIIDWTDYDQNGERGDSIWQSTIDQAGRTDKVKITRDNGSLEFIDYDQENNQSWDELIDFYRANGSLSERYTEQDNGAWARVYYDENGSRDGAVWMSEDGFRSWSDLNPYDQWDLSDSGVDLSFNYFFSYPPEEDFYW